MHSWSTALDSMRHSTEGFLALLDGVSDTQWHLRPAGEEWSIAETVEHVVLSNRGILARLGQLSAARAEGVAALTAACDGIAAWTKETPADLRGHGLPHPIFGTFDGVQWILFAAAHTDNHVPQLRAIRAHPEFARAS
jgi:hypothetical protein